MTSVNIVDKRIAISLASGVGALAAGDSYANIYSLARDWGMPLVQAALLPLAGDGIVFAASWVMLAAARRPVGNSGEPRVPFRLRLMFWGGVAASLGANWAYGYHHGYGLALLSVWAVLSYLGCTEALVYVQVHLRAHPQAASAPSPQIPRDAPRLKRADSLAATPRTRGKPAIGLLEDAELEYAAVLAAGDVPSLRALQDRFSIGQAKAQELQRILKGKTAVLPLHEEAAVSQLGDCGFASRPREPGYAGGTSGTPLVSLADGSRPGACCPG